MTAEEAYSRLENVIAELQDKFYSEHPDEKELPNYLWELFSINEYFITS